MRKKLHPYFYYLLSERWGFPGGSAVKNAPAMQEIWVRFPESGRSPGEGNGNPLQYSCLKNPMDRGAWRATVHEDARVGYMLATKQQSK